MKAKFDRLVGAGLALSGVLVSYVLTLCAAIFSDPSAVCSLSAHWCAGNDYEFNYDLRVFPDWVEMILRNPKVIVCVGVIALLIIKCIWRKK